MPVSNQDTSYSKTQWLIGVVIIPIAFTVIMGALIWGVFAGNLSEKAKGIGNSIPIVKQFVPGSNVTEATPSAEEKLRSEVEELKKQLTQKENTINELQKTIDEKNLSLAEAKANEDSQEEKRATAEERKKQWSDIADMYAGMSASKGAPILSALSLKESSLILSFMDEDARAEIISKMDPKKAADVSILLKDQTLSENDDIAALQERIQVLTDQLSEAENKVPTTTDLNATYNAMPAAGAAQILSELYKKDRQSALTVLSGVTDDKRSQILANMDPEDAATITQALAKN